MHVPFEDGSGDIATDSGPNGNDIELQGASWAIADGGQDGKSGEALLFDSTQDEFANAASQT